MTIDAMDRQDAGRGTHRDRRRRRALVPVALTAALVVAPLAAQAAPWGSSPNAANASFPAECPWMDTSLSAGERAQVLLDHSSLEQKMRWLVEQPAVAPNQTEWSGGVVYPEQVPCTPDLTFANGAHGLSATGGTAFPVPIAEAASFDPTLSTAKGAIVADEAHRGGYGVILGPGVAGGRTPLSGRTSEYYGEDPVLSGVLAAANIRGLEDTNPENNVVANLKHYVANEQELDRDLSSSNMDERTMQQIYGLGFEIATREGDPASIMCSYNQVNGVYACENEDLLTDEVEDRWDYDGFIMSDFGSVHSTAPSLDAGLDMELNRPIWYTPERLHAALDAGEITEEQIDTAAFEVVRAFIETGLFDNVPERVSDDLITDESRALALEMAEKGSVLLKNDAGTLPLADGALDVAVIGPTASNEPTDGISAVSVCSSYLPFGGGGTSVPCPDPVAPLDAITERVEAAGGSVTFANGSDLDEVSDAAAAADVAIVFGHYRMGEFSDIEDLRLDAGGDELIQTVAAAADTTVAVTQTGSAVEMPWIEDVDAVLHTWYAGREMGTAISNLLWGDVNPSGKLPMTFPASLADTPTQTPEQYPGVFADGSTERNDEEEIRQVEYSEGLQVGYRWYQAQGIEPLFAFGHGLSYTTFEYDKVKVTPQKVKEGRDVRVRFRLTNTGDVAGTEVAQVYVTLPDEAGEPFQRLVDFERVHLEPGEHRNVTITLSEDELETRHLLEYFDAGSDDWVTPSGTFEVRVGAASDDLSEPVELTVKGDDAGPAEWKQGKTYRAGDRVTYDDRVFEATWWTKRQTPGASPWGPWQELAETSEGTAVWTESRIFTRGDVVVHDGETYEAQWWNRNAEPGASRWGPWKKLG
ncbi:glycoside hydrolase family 3 C-terminal domain-containing protein [Isoptericola chiayiensis]|uniref:Glycoside hydrolase family 3 C-terminal domain-containing protein n=1 Tax=Isoptericola chiayiensis TaxID=579446 RepID=A0ABP8Y979_9MICO|nr:glycoside hydrolase family 3 C-terminal domain-containing protein [Isoptericola chiayiensis]NOW00709.1 beta-glucosidase [Isoptericola chiayiensis]